MTSDSPIGKLMMEHEYHNLEYYQLTDAETVNLTLGSKIRGGCGVEWYCRLLYKGRRLALRSPAMVFESGAVRRGCPIIFFLKDGKLGETPVFPEVLRRISDTIHNLAKVILPNTECDRLIFYSESSDSELFAISPNLYRSFPQRSCVFETCTTSKYFLCPNKSFRCGIFDIRFELLYTKGNVAVLIASEID